MARNENAAFSTAEKALTKETEKAGQYKDIVVEHGKIKEDLIKQIAALKAEINQAKTREDGLAAEKDAWDEKFKAEHVRL